MLWKALFISLSEILHTSFPNLRELINFRVFCYWPRALVQCDATTIRFMTRPSCKYIRSSFFLVPFGHCLNQCVNVQESSALYLVTEIWCLTFRLFDFPMTIITKRSQFDWLHQGIVKLEANKWHAQEMIFQSLIFLYLYANNYETRFSCFKKYQIFFKKNIDYTIF